MADVLLALKLLRQTVSIPRVFCYSFPLAHGRYLIVFTEIYLKSRPTFQTILNVTETASVAEKICT